MKPPVSVAFIRPRLGVGTSLNQPLQFMYVAAAIRRELRARIRIIDCELLGIGISEVLASLREDPPDVVGLTAMTVDEPAVQQLSEAIRAEFPQCWIWLGGSHASGAPKKALERLAAVDVVIQGEGEQTAVELLRRHQQGDRDAEGVAGTWTRDGVGAPQANPAREAAADLDELPMPAWDLIDVPAYFHTVRRMGILYREPAYMSLFTSRACPYRCSYCHSTFGKTFRAHSPERVLAEMDRLITGWGIREFAILDDIFNFDATRMAQICEGILSNGWQVHLSFPNGVRGDLFDRASLALLRRAGGWRLNFAPESSSERIQKDIRKHNRFDRLEQAIADADELGYLCQGNFMVGFPRETQAEMEETVKWALQSRLHLANFFRVIPLEGTPMAAEVRPDQHGPVHDPTQHDINETSINLSDVPQQDIEELRRRAYRSFHMSPRRLLRLATRLPRHPSLSRLYAEDAVARFGYGLPSGVVFRGGTQGA